MKTSKEILESVLEAMKDENKPKHEVVGDLADLKFALLNEEKDTNALIAMKEAEKDSAILQMNEAKRDNISLIEKISLNKDKIFGVGGDDDKKKQDEIAKLKEDNYRKELEEMYTQEEVEAILNKNKPKEDEK